MYGIEGREFSAGDELSSGLAGALDALAQEVRREAAELAG